MSRRKSNKRRKKRSKYDSKLLDLARVTRVTAGGRRLSFRAVMVLGDKKGKVGVGVAKANDVAQAIGKAKHQAQKKMVKVPIKDGTIAHEVIVKQGPAKVLLRPQRKGRGLVAGGVVRVICKLAGIEDISSKLLSRTRNKLNIARTTITALKKLNHADS